MMTSANTPVDTSVRAIGRYVGSEFGNKKTSIQTSENVSANTMDTPINASADTSGGHVVKHAGNTPGIEGRRGRK